MERLILKAGNTYVNTMSHPFKIVKFIDGYFWCDDDIPYYEDGNVHIGGRKMEDHRLCIVKEVITEEEIIMKDFMVDLETMGLDANSLITTVSIVQFDLTTGNMGEELELAISWNEQVDKGAIVDVSTVQWWLHQDREALDTMMRLEGNPVSEVISSINSYFARNSEDLRNVKLWGNGKEFDNVLLRNLYKRHNVIFPLAYWCDNDVRTLVSIADINTHNFAFDGVKHRGVDDCKHQINYCSHAYRVLKGL